MQWREYFIELAEVVKLKSKDNHTQIETFREKNL